MEKKSVNHLHEDCCHEHHHEDCCHEHHHEDCCHEHHHEDCCHEHHHKDCCHSNHREEPQATRARTHFQMERHPVPGHPDDCDCAMCVSFVEYCDLCGESLARCSCHVAEDDMEKRIYIMEGIDCPNCAAKIEAKIRQMPEVGFASVTFATKQLRVVANHQDTLLPKLQKVVNSVEDGVTLIPKDREKKGESTETKKTLFRKKPLAGIATGAVIFAAGLVLESWSRVPEAALFAIFFAAYLILGGEVLITAGRNILRGQIFDENFLMGIATIGAFCIGEFPEAVGVMLFYRIGEYCEDRATEKSRKQIMEAVDLRPEVVNRIEEDEVCVIDAQDAKVGDLLLVRPGDRIPLDGEIISGESRIDTSPVTGEPVPVLAKEGDKVISGCVNTSGLLKIRVDKVLEESMVTRILESVENAAASKPEIDRFITRFARVYTPFVVFLALFVAFLLPFLLPEGMNWHYFVNPAYAGQTSRIFGTSGTASVYTALTFLVISCPCALVLSVPLAFFSGIGVASKKGILFKGGLAIEALKNVKAVVLDKTGTITKGEFVVQEVKVYREEISEKDLLALAASCELSSTHPIAVSIVEEAKKREIFVQRPQKVEEISGEGIIAWAEQGTVLCGNRKLMERNKVSLDFYEKDNAGTEVLLALNGILAGEIVIADSMKEDAGESIARVKRLGIRTVMLTGDEEKSARDIGKKAGIDEVYAGLLPEEKLDILKKVREENGAVFFVGDGINDAPVLAGADVGAAMGSGADAAIEAADVVFMNSEMKGVPEALRIAGLTGRISWQNVIFALLVKAAVMILGLAGFANMWLAVFADTGVALLCLLNSIRLLYK